MLAGLLSVSLVLLGAWSAVVPIFESPDEVHHWQYARYLRDEWRLPLYSPAFVEANSPPLYYALIAPVATHDPGPPSLVWIDAKGSLALPFAPRLYHNAGGDLGRYWPMRLARLLSALMSVATVWFCWQAGNSAGGTVIAVLCGSLVAFLPQFTFRGSAISNDALVTTMSAATMLCAVRLIKQPYTWRIGVAAALAISSAYLSKISAICLIPPLALALWWSQGSLRDRFFRLAGVFGIAALVVTPWSIRNIVLYGDPFASGAMAGAVGHIMSHHSLFDPYFLTTFPSLLSRSFVGVFGWMNVMVPEGYYWFYWSIGLAGLVYLAVQLAAGRSSPRVAIVLSAIVLLNLAVVVHINRSFDQPQGRYMFVALPALGLLIALGLESPLRRMRAVLLAPLLLALLNVVILARYLGPAYYPPVTPTLSDALFPLASSYVIDLNPDGDGLLHVTGADPQIGFLTNLDAAQAGFLVFDITGYAPDSVLSGTIYFSADGRPAREAQQVPFIWRPDGRSQVVRVPMLSHPGWAGTINILRIDPINVAVDRNRGTRLRIGNVRVVGNLSRIGQ